MNMRMLCRSLVLALGLPLALSGCGDEPQPALDVIKAGVGSLGKRQQPPSPTADQIRATATPEALAQIGKPVMLAELPQRGLADILIFVQQNGPYKTWSSTDGVSFIFKNGLLTGTRGMGFDLMTADVEEPARAIAAGGGEAVRIHRYLDGELQMQARAFVCKYGRLQAGGITEDCTSPDYAFENQYWFGAGGKLRKSRQWIGPDRGYLISEPLN